MQHVVVEQLTQASGTMPRVDPERHSDRAGIGIGLLGALIGAGTLLAIHFWRTLPLWDQWEAIFLYWRWSENGWQAADLAGQQNEHRPLLTNLLFLADFEFFRGTAALTRLCLLAVQFSLGTVIGLLATVGHRRAYRALGITLSIALLASPFNIDNLILPYHVSIPLVCLLALLAFHWTTVAALAPTWRDAATATFLSCSMIMLGPYATANGLIAAVMAAALVWFLRANRLSAALVTASAAIIIVIYFWHWTFPQHHEELLASPFGIRGLWQIATHSLVLLGAPALLLGPAATGVFGFVGFVLWLALLVAAVQQVRQSPALDAHFIALFALATFALGTAVMIGLGRAGAGLGQALSTRYATFSLVFWLALLGAMWRWRANTVGELSLRLERRAVLGLAITLLAFTYGVWFRVADSWRTQVAVSDQMTAELLAGRFDPVLMAQLYPHVDRLPAAIEFLRHRELSIFARRERR